MAHPRISSAAVRPACRTRPKLRRDPADIRHDPAEVRHDPDARHIAVTLLAGYAIISSVLIAVGLILFGPLKNTSLLRWDDRPIETMAAHRTTSLNSFSRFWSKFADAPGIVAVGLVAAIALFATRHRRAVLILAISLVLELGTFLTVSYVVFRSRPDVEHLGSVPSTGSFPSGHVAATLVVYGLITMMLWRYGAPQFVVFVGTVFTVLAGIVVAWSRMYRGMHHPLDVVAGGLMGAALLFVFYRAEFSPRPRLRSDSSTEQGA